MLPCLEALRLPIPLGGTSNHFKRAALAKLGAWDPYNVTEDADLGMRIARAGLRTRIIASTTWEEAPETLAPWVRQRTRWLKGWMQTWLVHVRAGATLWRELGITATACFHVLLAGHILSTLSHPLLLVLLVQQWQAGVLFEPAQTVAETGMHWVAWANLGVGYMAAMLTGAACVVRRRHRGVCIALVSMPVYWLLASLACYRALFQLVRDPYRWEKTPHGVSETERAPLPKQGALRSHPVGGGDT